MKHRSGDILGYARVSSAEQDVAGQKDRLEKAGAIRIFQDVISGKHFERPGLTDLIDHARSGDSLCIVRLDRLGRSLKELLETVDDLMGRGINLISLEKNSIHPAPPVNWCFMSLVPSLILNDG
jgi:DNA invertase Pin-like site-specific DNA recombinase